MAPPKRPPIPEFIPPQHPLLVAHAPKGERWLHEIKFDGYRVQVRVEKKRAAVRTREGHDWTDRFAGCAAAAAALPDCIIDGEAVILVHVIPLRSTSLVLFHSAKRIA